MSNIETEKPKAGGSEALSNNTLANAGGPVNVGHAPEPAKLFVGQVPDTMAEHDLLLIMEEFGEVIDLIILQDRHNLMRHKGCAFVTYRTRAEADRAIEALDAKVRLSESKREMVVRYANVKRPEFKLFVGMLSRETEEAQVKKYFEKYGDIIEVHVIRDSGGRSKGCAFVKFGSKEEADRAIEALDGQIRDGSAPRQLQVRYARERNNRKHYGRNRYHNHGANYMYDGMNPYYGYPQSVPPHGYPMYPGFMDPAYMGMAPQGMMPPTASGDIRQPAAGDGVNQKAAGDGGKVENSHMYYHKHIPVVYVYIPLSEDLAACRYLPVENGVMDDCLEDREDTIHQIVSAEEEELSDMDFEISSVSLSNWRRLYDVIVALAEEYSFSGCDGTEASLDEDQLPSVNDGINRCSRQFLFAWTPAVEHPDPARKSAFSIEIADYRRSERFSAENPTASWIYETDKWMAEYFGICTSMFFGDQCPDGILRSDSIKPFLEDFGARRVRPVWSIEIASRKSYGTLNLLLATCLSVISVMMCGLQWIFERAGKSSGPQRALVALGVGGSVLAISQLTSDWPLPPVIHEHISILGSEVFHLNSQTDSFVLVIVSIVVYVFAWRALKGLSPWTPVHVETSIFGPSTAKWISQCFQGSGIFIVASTAHAVYAQTGN